MLPIPTPTSAPPEKAAADRTELLKLGTAALRLATAGVILLGAVIGLVTVIVKLL